MSRKCKVAMLALEKTIAGVVVPPVSCKDLKGYRYSGVQYSEAAAEFISRLGELLSSMV